MPLQLVRKPVEGTNDGFYIMALEEKLFYEPTASSSGSADNQEGFGGGVVFHATNFGENKGAYVLIGKSEPISLLSPSSRRWAFCPVVF